MGEKRYLYRILVRTEKEGVLGRPRHRSEDDIMLEIQGAVCLKTGNIGWLS
jgi:hypothetical protein